MLLETDHLISGPKTLLGFATLPLATVRVASSQTEKQALLAVVFGRSPTMTHLLVHVKIMYKYVIVRPLHPNGSPQYVAHITSTRHVIHSHPTYKTAPDQRPLHLACSRDPNHDRHQLSSHPPNRRRSLIPLPRPFPPITPNPHPLPHFRT